MRYVEVKFDYSFGEEYLLDLFVQGLADMGFESFTDDAAYIPAQQFDEQALRAYAEENGQKIRSVTTVEDQNWNAVWEAEHPVQELPLGVRITPHCAFGAGYHETTAMMIDALIGRDLTGQTVLDMGCGTGVLGIFAKKRGARSVVAMDIDDKSVANTQENAADNGVTLDVRLGDTPPELAADIYKSGIYLAGGGSLLRGLDQRIASKTKLKVHIAEDPLRAVARGTGIALENFNKFSFLIK